MRAGRCVVTRWADCTLPYTSLSMAVKLRARESSDRHPHIILLQMDASFQFARARLQPFGTWLCDAAFGIRIYRFGPERGGHPSRGPPISWFSFQMTVRVDVSPGDCGARRVCRSSSSLSCAAARWLVDSSGVRALVGECREVARPDHRSSTAPFHNSLNFNRLTLSQKL